MKQEYGKPMSLSYVMDTPIYRNQDNYLPHDLSLPQSPQSAHSSSSPSLSISSSFSSPPHRPQYQGLSDEDGTDYSNPGGLTLLERRQRNKTASAKYRQKKNKQQSEMKRMIDSLTEQDALLKRQMVELRMENQRLKSMNEHLRGKILAKKMLDQYFERHHLQTPPCFSPEQCSDHAVDDNESLDSF
ncbi:hypothetical protein BC941DRAFT_410391 [Chlamydoabsidia padenii]|nr:hypothetical protein BC941DRAFT_410391 [Chlamydoabsidia padenii]